MVARVRGAEGALWHAPRMIDQAVEALERSGVRFSFRKGPTTDGELPDGGEVDLAVDAAEVPKLDAALKAAGLFHMKAPGHLDHRFYMASAAGRWVKFDVKTPARRRWMGGLTRRLGMRRPVSVRRTGPIVAIVGPDGAGKGTAIAELRRRIPMGVAVIYLGGRKKAGRSARAPGPGEAAKPTRPAREVAWIGVRWLRVWRLLASAYAKAWRGLVVLCDRHPIEILATRPPRTRLGERVERFAFGRLLPRPDALVVLDAPGEVLFERKGEHSPDVLERWRRGYLDALVPLGARVVSTERPLDESVSEISAIVWDELRARRGW